MINPTGGLSTENAGNYISIVKSREKQCLNSFYIGHLKTCHICLAYVYILKFFYKMFILNFKDNEG